MDKAEFLKRQPGFPLYGTPWQPSPFDCPHFIAPFVGYEYMKRPPYEVNGITRCDDCGLIMRKPLSVREAGRKGAVELDDPRVMKHLIMNRDGIERLYHEKDGRGGTKPGMEIFQVPRSYGGARS